MEFWVMFIYNFIQI